MDCGFLRNWAQSPAITHVKAAQIAPVTLLIARRCVQLDQLESFMNKQTKYPSLFDQALEIAIKEGKAESSKDADPSQCGVVGGNFLLFSKERKLLISIPLENLKTNTLITSKLFTNLGIFIPLLVPSLMQFGMKLDMCRLPFLKIFFLTNFTLHIFAILAARKVFLRYGILTKLFVLFMPFIYWLFVYVMFQITFRKWVCWGYWNY